MHSNNIENELGILETRWGDYVQDKNESEWGNSIQLEGSENGKVRIQHLSRNSNGANESPTPQTGNFDSSMKC